MNNRKRCSLPYLLIILKNFYAFLRNFFEKIESQLITPSNVLVHSNIPGAQFVKPKNHDKIQEQNEKKLLEKLKKEQGITKPVKPVAPPAAKSPALPAAPVVKENSDVHQLTEAQKRIRTLKKKIREIEAFEEKMPDITDSQMEKVKGKSALEAELHKLEREI